MERIVYPIHRAVGRPLLFKGFRAQYILIAAGSLVGNLLLFVILYICGVTPWVCISLAFGLSALTLWITAGLSRRFGTHGLMKYFAHRSLPKEIRCKSRHEFLDLLKVANDKADQ